MGLNQVTIVLETRIFIVLMMHIGKVEVRRREMRRGLPRREESEEPVGGERRAGKTMMTA
jgi:hypothetical protein